MQPYFEDSHGVIYCGDCREILPQLPKVDLVLTDPPYGVGRKYGEHYNDKREGYWEWFIPTMELIKQSGKVVAIHHLLNSMKHITDWDWVIAWYKPFGAGARIGNSPILPHWEPILLWGIHSLGAKRECLQDWISCNPEPSPRKQYDKSPRHTDDCESSGHPLPKPIALEKKLISRLSKPGDIVLDPFCGSGTTIVAAKSLGRKYIGIEIEEKYCHIAVERLRQTVMDLKVEDTCQSALEFSVSQGEI